MQTFLPYPSFQESARCLDYRRLGKQRVEARQIISICEGNAKSNAWSKHPAVLMWHGHLDALRSYFNAISQEWVKRGYQHNMGFYPSLPFFIEYPPWVGNEVFHLSHQSNLVRKLPEHYRKYFPTVPNDLPYVWPR